MKYSLINSKFLAKNLRPCILPLAWGCILTSWTCTSLAQESPFTSRSQTTLSSGIPISADPILIAEGPSSEPLDNNSVYINETDGTVSVQVEEVPLGEVLDLLAAQGNIKVSISGNDGNRRISEHFSSLPIEKALHRLLRETNYALVYSRDSNVAHNNGKNNIVTGVVIMNTGEEAPLREVLPIIEEPIIEEPVREEPPATEEPQEIEKPSPRIDNPDAGTPLENQNLDAIPSGTDQH